MSIPLLGNDKGISTTVANGDLGNADTSYTYFNMLAEDWKFASIMFPTLTATTLSLEATTDNVYASGYTDAAANWTDCTNALTGSTTATATGGWILDTDMSVQRMRVKRLTTNATNALKLRIMRTR